MNTPRADDATDGQTRHATVAMYPLKTIIDFLLSGVSRIAPDERADALCTLFAGLLPEMSEAEIGSAREQVIARFWASPETSDAVVDLIDGHLALRRIFATPLSSGASRHPFSES